MLNSNKPTGSTPGRTGLPVSRPNRSGGFQPPFLPFARSAKLHLLLFTFYLLTFHVLTFAARAEEEGPNPLSPVLVSEVTAIQPGKPFWVGLWLDHPKHYHTYWKAPGIVGIPTELEWELPDGFSAGEILYPVPKRVSMAGINAHGYHGKTLLIVQITPPTDLSTDTVRLRALASWMCCWKTCHPGFEHVEISLPVDRSAKEPSWDPKWRPIFEATREKFPKPLKGWEITAVETEDSLVFQIKPRPDANAKPNPGAASVYFFCGDGQVNSGSPQILRRAPDGTLTLTMSRSQFGPEEAKTYHGLLFCKEGWLAGHDLQYGAVEIPRTDPRPNPTTKP